MARRPVNRLSARTVQTIKEPGRHADGAGLYLHVDPSGAKRWVFVFQWRNKRKEMGLGPVSIVSLAEAREEREKARKLVFQGVNPIEARKRVSEAPTFKAMADELIPQLALRSEKHRDQWSMTINQYASALHKMPVDEIDTDAVLDVLKPIWNEIPDTAQRLRGRIERILDAAKAKGYRSGENPARWRGHIALLMPKAVKLKRGHHAAMPFEEAPAFMARLAKKEGAGARALEFTILTASRTGMTIGAPMSEVDREKKVWTIPAHRMKANKEHRVPLTDRMLEIYDERPDGPFIFSAKAEKPLSNMTMDKVLRDMDIDATVHGFRSTFRDWAGDRTDFPRDLAEQALAHTVGDETERAYRRGDALAKRRKLMESWEKYLRSELARDPVHE